MNESIGGNTTNGFRNLERPKSSRRNSKLESLNAGLTGLGQSHNMVVGIGKSVPTSKKSKKLINLTPSVFSIQRNLAFL